MDRHWRGRWATVGGPLLRAMHDARSGMIRGNPQGATAMENSRGKRIIGLIGWLAICFVAAAIGAAASVDAGPFYAGLVRPGWAPPASVFGPVWSVLFVLMAVAAWLVWRKDGFRAARVALLVFLGQLALNALWSWLFFAWHRGGLAFADILVLLAMIVATMVAFWRVRPLAGALLIPYLLWVGFASALNLAVWRLNPQVLG
jgi:translocator protein